MLKKFWIRSIALIIVLTLLPIGSLAAATGTTAPGGSGSGGGIAGTNIVELCFDDASSISDTSLAKSSYATLSYDEDGFEGGAAKFTMKTDSTSSKKRILQVKNIVWKKGGTYTISFMAKSSVDISGQNGDVMVVLGDKAPALINGAKTRYPNMYIKASTEWQQFTKTFTIDDFVNYTTGESLGIEEATAVLQFEPKGLAVGEVIWLDNIVVNEVLPVAPTAPVISDLVVYGEHEVGSTLTAEVVVYDENKDDVLSIDYQWQAMNEDGDWMDIPGANASTFVITEEYRYSDILVLATPVSNNEPEYGSTVESNIIKAKEKEDEEEEDPNSIKLLDLTFDTEDSVYDSRINTSVGAKYSTMSYDAAEEAMKFDLVQDTTASRRRFFNTAAFEWKKGCTYTISFRAKASVVPAQNRAAAIIMLSNKVFLADGTSMTYPGLNPISLGDSWKKYSKTFTIQGFAADKSAEEIDETIESKKATIGFEFGGLPMGETIWVDDIVITETLPKDEPEEPEVFDFTYEIADGEAMITDCNEAATEIVIPETIEGYPVTKIGNHAFGYCYSLESITIPDSVTSIGVRAFECCSSLASITIPDSVTSIGNYAFSYCESLTSITIPGSVTSIGGYAFSDCISLKSITIPDSVTSIGEGAFYYCSSLESITIYNKDTEIGDNAFDGCNNLTLYGYRNSTTESYANEYGIPFVALDGEEPEEPEVPAEPSTKNVVEFRFDTVDSLNHEQLVVSRTNVEMEYDAAEAAAKFTAITDSTSVQKRVVQVNKIIWKKGATYTISFRAKATSPVTGGVLITFGSTKAAVFDDGKIYTYPRLNIKASNNWVEHTKTFTIMDFVNNSTGESVGVDEVVSTLAFEPRGLAVGETIWIDDIVITETLPEPEEPEEPEIPDEPEVPASAPVITSLVLSGSTMVGEVLSANATVTDANTEDILSVAYQWQYSFDDDIWQDIPGANGTTFTVDGLYSGAMIRFVATPVSNNEPIYGTAVAAGAVGPMKDTSFGFTYRIKNDEAVIIGCPTTVARVIIPDEIHGYPVTKIEEYAFANCDKLTTVTISDSVKGIGFCAFAGCSSLKSIEIPESVEYIHDCAFDTCSNLNAVTIYNKNAEIGTDAFINCSNLTLYGYRNSTTESHANEYGFAFVALDGEEPEDPDVPDEPEDPEVPVFTYELTATGEAMITGYDWDATFMEIPGTIDGFNVTGIKDDAFLGYENLREVTMPTTITYIGNFAFAKCYDLEKITIPDSVTFIGDDAFDYCDKLVIYGYNGTAAYRFAINNGFSFVALDTNIPVEGLVLSDDVIILNVCDTKTLTANVYPEDATNKNIIWETSDEDVVTVENGVVTAHNPGTAYIYATTEDGGYRASCTVMVKPDEDLSLEFINIDDMLENQDGWTNKNGSVLAAGDNVYFDDKGSLVLTNGGIARYTYEKFTNEIFTFKMRFEPLDPDVEIDYIPDADTIDFNLNGASFKVRGQNTSGDVYDKETDYGILKWLKNATYEIQEYTPSMTITLIPNDVFTEVNRDYTVSYGAYDKAGKTYVIMFVDGVCVYEFECKSDANFGLDGFLTFRGPNKSTAKMIISPVETPVCKVEGIYLDKDYISMNTGDTTALKATVYPEDATNKNIIWETSDEDVVTVENGVVTAHNPGTAYIYATTEDGGYRATCKVDVALGEGSRFQYSDLIFEIVNGEAVIIDFSDYVTDVIIPDSVHGFSVTTIGANAFSFSGIRSIAIPRSITRIENDAFAYCQNLTDITIPDSVIFMGHEVFYYCPNLKSITMPMSVEYIGYGAFFTYSDVVIYCQENSYANLYAVEYGIRCSHINNKIKSNSIAVLQKITQDGGVFRLDMIENGKKVTKYTTDLSVINGYNQYAMDVAYSTYAMDIAYRFYAGATVLYNETEDGIDYITKLYPNPQTVVGYNYYGSDLPSYITTYDAIGDTDRYISGSTDRYELFTIYGKVINNFATEDMEVETAYNYPDTTIHGVNYSNANIVVVDINHPEIAYVGTKADITVGSYVLVRQMYGHTEDIVVYKNIFFSINAPTNILKPGESTYVTVYGQDFVGGQLYSDSFKITSSDESVVTVDKDGYVLSGLIKLTAHKSGTAIITVSCEGYETSFAVTVEGNEPDEPEKPFDPDAPTVSATHIKAITGNTVTVDVMLDKNQGFVALGIEIGYDSDIMTLVDVEDNPEVNANFTGAQKIGANPYNLNWNSTENVEFNGRLATLTFEIKEGAANGNYPITVKCYKGRYGDYVDGEDTNYDEEFNPLNLNYKDGSVSVMSFIPGDANGDNVINHKDATVMLRFLAGWEQEGIIEEALDVTGDGKINNRDATNLLRYLAGWDVEIG